MLTNCMTITSSMLKRRKQNWLQEFRTNVLECDDSLDIDIEKLSEEDYLSELADDDFCDCRGFESPIEKYNSDMNLAKENQGLITIAHPENKVLFVLDLSQYLCLPNNIFIGTSIVCADESLYEDIIEAEEDDLQDIFMDAYDTEVDILYDGLEPDELRTIIEEYKKMYSIKVIEK